MTFLRLPVLPVVGVVLLGAACGGGGTQPGPTQNSIAKNGGDAQTDTVDATLATAYAVIVRNPSNAPVPGVTVNWAVTAGGGSVSAATSTTDATGIASVTRKLGPTAGAQTAQASATGLSGSPVSFTATATAGNATQIAINGGNNQTGPANSALPIPYSVVARDRNNNPTSGVVVTWAVASGGGSVNPTQSTTAADGTASTTRTLGPGAGTQTATATASGLAGSPLTFSATATVAPMAASVSVRDDFFSPASVTIAAGGTVTWTWAGLNPHTVTFDPPDNRNSGAAKSSGTFSLTFSTPGTFTYICTVHGRAVMSGSVTVQ